MIKVGVEGETLGAVKAALVALLASLGAEVVADETKKGPGRPPKAGKTAAEQAADLGLDSPTPAAAVAAPKVVQNTVEEVKAAMNELMAQRTGDADETAGVDRVKAVLKKLGAANVSGLKPAQYNEAVDAAQKA